MYEITGRIGGKPREAVSTMPIIDKFTDEQAGTLHVSSPADLDEALQQASGALGSPLSGRDRAAILRRVARRLADTADELCNQQRIEAGFTQADGRREIARAVDTLLLSADEANRFGGEFVPLGSASGVQNRIGVTIRKPIGVVAAITPFNSPVNAICHKLGAAIAAGNAVVLKPAEVAPSTGVAIADAFFDAGLPTAWLHVIHGPGGTIGAQLVEDPRVGFIAFTGSTETGNTIQRVAGLRPTQLELGSISATVIADDALVDDAMLLDCANAAFRKAGQVCTSIQRLYVQRGVANKFIPAFLKAVRSLKVGDPRLADTTVGPMISRSAANRIENWIKEAVDGGAQILLGGNRAGTVVSPIVLRGVRPGMRLHDEEAFGPVVCLYEFDEDDEAIRAINSTPYGLASGIFTHNLDRAMNFAQWLDVGTLHVNASSSSRVDIMPYGGLKASGHGLEGPAYAVKEMSRQTLLSLQWTS